MHYYVLSLGEKRSALFEAFRDSLIEVESQGFPVVGASGPLGSPGPERRLELGREIDRCFGRHQAAAPLNFVVVGAPTMLDAFQAVTRHGDARVGMIEGDHEATGVRDLGRIVWPLVRQAMSGELRRAMGELCEAAGRRRVAFGLEDVVRATDGRRGPTLLVEDDYHVRGSIVDTPRPSTIISDVDVRATIDDVVDLVIERVLGIDGDVIFAPSGSLGAWQRIVLLQRGRRPPESRPVLEEKVPS